MQIFNLNSILMVILGMFACSIEQAQSTEKNVLLSVQVQPYYDSKKALINVSRYSESLGTESVESLKATAEQMLKEKPLLTPEQMYVVAVRMYNLGLKDEALYWFYEARYRSGLFVGALKDRYHLDSNSETFKLWTAYNAFYDQTKDVFNQYAEQDYDRWLKLIRKVRALNRFSVPDLVQLFPDSEFVDDIEIINEKVVGSRLDELAMYVMDKQVGGLDQYLMKKKNVELKENLERRVARETQSASNPLTSPRKH